MTGAETEDTATLLREISRTHSIVVVEHDMTFVRALGVKVTCLHEGSVLAEGTIYSVSAHFAGSTSRQNHLRARPQRRRQVEPSARHRRPARHQRRLDPLEGPENLEAPLL
jgi:ABC-type methionine transport system ATPase subunit